MSKPLKVATYSRVSTDDKGQNPEVQAHDLRRYCEARGWTIAHEIVDHGYSGGSDKRPGLKKLMDLAKAREIDVVVTVKLDRIFRSLKNLIVLLDEWQALGVEFVATRDSIDYTTPSGRLFAQILGSLAEFEKSLLRERTLMGLAFARSQGKKLGRPKKRDDAAILSLHREGLSYSQIQKRLGVSRPAIHRALKAAGTKTAKVSK
jgi:DNA invertase Pin-like site-specific DNA recombinase